MKNNKFSYELSDGSIVKGFFNIYQGRNGYIYLMLRNNATQLTLEQIEELNIELYSMKDFDHDSFKKAYGVRSYVV